MLHVSTDLYLTLTEHKKPKVEKKEPESPSSTIPKIPLMDPKSVRANAKKALFQTLWKRCVHKRGTSSMYVLSSLLLSC